jgi:molecular chaperone GrpE
MAKRPQVETEEPSAVPGSDAAEPDEPAVDEVPGTSVAAVPPAEEVDESGASDATGDTKLAELQRERDEYLDLAQRTRAELENFRKRSARESTDAERRGRAHVARGLVPAVDSLERALQAAGVNLDPASFTESPDPPSREVSAHEALAAGVALVHGEIVGALRAAGVESFDPAGEKFDPNVHQAMYEVPDPSVPAGTIAQVIQSGYMIGERILRPALVGVAKGGAKAAASE